MIQISSNLISALLLYIINSNNYKYNKKYSHFSNIKYIFKSVSILKNDVNIIYIGYTFHTQFQNKDI